MAYSPKYPESKVATARMRSSTYQIAGLGNSSLQTLIALWNGQFSTKKFIIKMAKIDVQHNTGQLVTLPPNMFKVHRLTTQPSGGSAIPYVSGDTAYTPSDATSINSPNSGDLVAAGTAHVVSIPAANAGCLSQEFTPRYLSTTPTGYEMFDTDELLEGSYVVIRPNEGIALTIHPTTSLSNPSTIIYVATLEWFEVPTAANFDPSFNAVDFE